MPGWGEFVKAYQQGEKIKTREQASPVEREILAILVDIQEVVHDLRGLIKQLRGKER